MIQITIKWKTVVAKTYHNHIRTLYSVDGKWTKIDEVYTGDALLFATLLKQIENYWKPIINKHWSEVLRNNESTRDSKYILSMFPYPSGSAHLGHARTYTTSDILARYYHLHGKAVIHPMGFDSFGLPAENAARQHSVQPNEWTQFNIQQMRAQFDKLGFEFNWRENTSDKSYYKWTQWLFLQLYKFGLAYRGMGFVNWDPIDCTVLADEQVDENGCSWRSGAKVEKKAHRQWFIKTNSLANDLYKATDIDTTGHWAEIVTHQRWWVKQPNGYLFYLKLSDSEDVLQVYTKHPELFLSDKVFVAVSSKHWLALSDKFIDKVVNPFTNNIMDIRIVDNNSMPQSTQSTLMVLRESFEDIELRDMVLNRSRELNVGGYFTSDTYRDWLISRQRYWGTPIPIVFCDKCGIQPVSEVDLPIELPTLTNVKNNLSLSEKISNPIKDYAPIDWLHTECPNCGSSTAIRETETCDTFFDSSWYFLRYITEPLDNLPFDPLRVEPTSCYVGGREHSALHLFYARFITHFLHEKGLCHFREPFKALLMQRHIKAKTYKFNGKYITAEEARLHSDGVVEEYEKMSKSKGNGVNPDELVDAYGCDALRWCILSDSSAIKDRLWDSDHTKEFKHPLTYLRRVLLTIEEFIEIRQYMKDPQNFTPKLKIRHLSDSEIEEAKCKLNEIRNCAIVSVRKSFEYSYYMRHAINALDLLLGQMRAYSQITQIRTIVPITLEYERALAALIIMMSPIVPHFAAECWTSFAREAVGSYEYDIKRSLLYQKWPTIDSDTCLHQIIFCYTNTRGQQEECHVMNVKRKHMGNWTQQEIRTVIDTDPENREKNLCSDNIDKINIIRDVMIDVRLKVKPSYVENKRRVRKVRKSNT